MRIQHVSKFEVILHFENRESFTLYSSEGKVNELMDEFLCPLDQSNFTRLSDYNRAVAQSDEITEVIDQDYSLELEMANLCM